MNKGRQVVQNERSETIESADIFLNLSRYGT